MAAETKLEGASLDAYRLCGELTADDGSVKPSATNCFIYSWTGCTWVGLMLPLDGWAAGDRLVILRRSDLLRL